MKPQRIDRIVQVIEQLKDGCFHSGEDIGSLLGVSRAAVSQYIKDIQDLGVDVFRVTGKGYRLSKGLKLLNIDSIGEYLNKAGTTKTNVVLERILGSTNDYIKNAITSDLESGFCVLSEAQTQGRGRRGKQWISPFGNNLYMSMYWRLEQGMSAAMGLSIALGTVIADVLTDLGVFEVEVKWPNDILVHGKKIAGILIELEGQALGAAHTIIGIGINIEMSPWLAKHIEQPWTDIATELQGNYDRNEFAATLIGKCRSALEDYETHGLRHFLSDWNKYDRLAKQPVRIIMGDKEIHGIAEGIDDTGALLITREGKLEKYHAGEVSLRYGI